MYWYHILNYLWLRDVVLLIVNESMEFGISSCGFSISESRCRFNAFITLSFFFTCSLCCRLCACYTVVFLIRAMQKARNKKRWFSPPNYLNIFLFFISFLISLVNFLYDVKPLLSSISSSSFKSQSTWFSFA